MKTYSQQAVERLVPVLTLYKEFGPQPDGTGGPSGPLSRLMTDIKHHLAANHLPSTLAERTAIERYAKERTRDALAERHASLTREDIEQAIWKFANDAEFRERIWNILSQPTLRKESRP